MMSSDAPLRDDCRPDAAGVPAATGLPADTDTPRGAGRYEGPLRVFLGRDGLRAGWACLLFLVCVAGIGSAVRGVVALLYHPHKPAQAAAMAPGLMIVGELIPLGIVLLATLLMAFLERRRFLTFGLGGRANLPRFLGGLIAGFAAISALVGILAAGGLLTLASARLPAVSELRYGLLWALGFLCVALFEENLLRGYLLFTLRRGIGFWPAALLLSAAFGFIHHSNPGESPVGLFSAAAVGLFLCLSIWYTGSLWWAIGFHAAWDWGESFFWGTSDSGLHVQGHLLNEAPRGPLLWSGGATGPEGSLWVFVVLGACALLAWLWWRRVPRHLPLHTALTGE